MSTYKEQSNSYDVEVYLKNSFTIKQSPLDVKSVTFHKFSTSKESYIYLNSEEFHQLLNEQSNTFVQLDNVLAVNGKHIGKVYYKISDILFIKTAMY